MVRDKFPAEYFTKIGRARYTVLVQFYATQGLEIRRAY